MMSLIIDQLIWLGIGLALGVQGTICYALHKGWWGRRTTAADLAKEIAPLIEVPKPQLNLDWDVIYRCVAGSGYDLIQRPKDSDNVARPN